MGSLTRSFEGLNYIQHRANSLSVSQLAFTHIYEYILLLISYLIPSKVHNINGHQSCHQKLCHLITNPYMQGLRRYTWLGTTRNHVKHYYRWLSRRFLLIIILEDFY